MISKDLVAASSKPLILSILEDGESYGYAILQRVHELSGEQIEWTEGMLYPVLHRLEGDGLISARWTQADWAGNGNITGSVKRGEKLWRPRRANG